MASKPRPSSAAILGSRPFSSSIAKPSIASLSLTTGQGCGKKYYVGIGIQGKNGKFQFHVAVNNVAADVSFVEERDRASENVLMASTQALRIRSSSSTLSLSSKIFEQSLIFTSSLAPIKQASKFPISKRIFYPNQYHFSCSWPLYATLNSPKGFGPPPKKTKKTKKSRIVYDDDDDDDDDDDGDDDNEPDAGIIPEVVTNRMISRMGFSVGIPLFIGLLFFPFFYYLKVGLKIDVPTWVPFIVSFFFFGSALLGVSYGIVSSSWDPMREGSLLGWNEAQKNWPVFWQSLWGRSGKK
ncbi:hypothetical protein P3X46_020241 [Hevea brasiliensis]|uniref:Protein PAM68, chloroplastic n=1 Tax=Hevea brasiliensis TaxID=3981 RepID=A0ABQ9LL94_HEVBR|nr:protein PAM68, chloroplastic isoform X1 [Hevea brasiliensis]KAJ9168749.1 hypothetical protein P3X46_020241 [Hevea brasiliensis]